MFTYLGKKIAMNKFLLAFSLLFTVANSTAQSAEILAIRKVRTASEHSWLQQYVSFLSIPNVADDENNIARNAARIMELMQERNIGNVQLLHPLTKGAPPAVFGEVKVPGATKTIAFYAHYDGQPVDSTKWAAGFHPFKPVLIKNAVLNQSNIIPFPEKGQPIDPEWRIVSRGTSDDKGGVLAILLAYEALKQSGQTAGCNIKFFFEGEEEAGSPHLGEILQQHKALLNADIWVICDGPVHQSGSKQISFGVRGDVNMDIVVYGSKRPLHSGHYGNWAPNPALQLSRLLASMKDEQGKVLIKGFYDDVIPLSAAEKKALAAVPKADAQLKKELGFIRNEIPGTDLAESLLLPSLNINGIQSANAGKLAANVIPVQAMATLDLRLVKGNDQQVQQQRVVDHIKAQGFYVTEQEPTDAERTQYPKIARVIRQEGYNAQRTSMDLPIAKDIAAAVQKTTAGNLILVPSLGGSLPLFLFEKHLKVNTITVPLANHDNNQHAENENIRLQNFWNGIETMASIMMIK